MAFKWLLVSFVVLNMTMFSCGSYSKLYADTPTTKAWTLLVYLDGDNNLDTYGDTNMQQMEQVGSTDDVNVIVLRDRADQTISAKIYYITKGGANVVKDYGKNLDMGDWNNLVDFFRYVKDTYPADHYIVDVWDHGGGWGTKSLAKAEVFKDIAWDDGTGHSITTPQLGQALAAMKQLNGGKNIDILGTDACLMQMAEVVNEVSPSVDVFAGSEETEPGTGWDYTAPLQFLTQNPGASALEVGAHIQQAYVAANISSGDVQGSSVSTSALVVAEEKIAAFADALAKFDKLDRTAVQNIISATQAFAMSDFHDLIDFASHVAQGTTDKTLAGAATEVVTAVKAAVYANYTAGSTLASANGLSVWLPDSSSYQDRHDTYALMTWPQATHWQVFLDNLYNSSEE